VGARADTLDLRQASALLASALGVPEAFPWQYALLERLATGDLPRAVDLPTGLGKTSIIALWLLARATGAQLPTRLVYVVDRRAVVDQASDEAERLRAFVDQHPEVRAALGLTRPLPISTLRGQHVDNRAWLDDPSEPAIIVGTVDMVGSRLLFSGYGVSRKMRPYHAGLLGADSLFVLDEAHLVPPFERLLEAIAVTQAREFGPEAGLPVAGVPAQMISLSATGRELENVHRLGRADEDHPVVQQRVRAHKQLIVRDEVTPNQLASRLVEEALQLVENARQDAARVVVFCNRRSDAERVAADLRKKLKDGASVELLVGARRVHERQAVSEWLSSNGFRGTSTAADEPALPAILVATSAGEVGVDFDAQHAVFDLVAWERMVQRLGRVNRRGAHRSSVVIVPATPDAKDETTAARLASALALIRELPRLQDGLDGSPAALAELRARAGQERIRSASTPAPLFPPLARAHVDAWAMTWLEEHTGRPEVAPWLRGWDTEEDPQALVFFREELPLVDQRVDAGLLDAYLDAAGPHADERLEVSVGEVAEWLKKRADHPGLRDTAGRWLPIALVSNHRGAFALSIESVAQREKKRLEKDLAGATVIVKASFGGLVCGLLSATAPLPEEDAPSLDLTQHADSVVPFRLRAVDTIESLDAEGFRFEAAFVLRHDEEGAPCRWLVIERRASAPPATEVGRSVARRAQGLAEHGSWVAEEAARLAARLGLPPAIRAALLVAAQLHDEGKAAERWQRAFGVRPEERPLAKSTRGVNQKLLGGYRHELGSLPRMEKHPAFESLDPEQRELALHLVAAHHGRARPILPTEDAEEPPARLQQRARDAALRFDRLSRRYGPWGLAWLEALLRAADARASRRNDEGT